MNKLIVGALAVILLTGCATMQPAEKEIVIVNKPIAFIPKPPAVPKISYQVDKLTHADLADPGKVGQAYKHDLIALRKLVEIYQIILQQYSESSVDFELINSEIDLLFKQIPGGHQ